MSEVNVEKYDEEVWQTIHALEQLRAQREEIAERIRAMSLAATDALRASTSARNLADLGPSEPLVRELYWNQADVHVEHIQRATGAVDSRDVRRLAGIGHFETPCLDGCGTIIVRDLTSRTAARQTGGYTKSIDPRRCDACRAKHRVDEDERHRSWRLQTDAESEESLAAFRQAIDAGLQPSRRYVEYPGVPGTWADPEFETSD